jgi:hypothetical protein
MRLLVCGSRTYDTWDWPLIAVLEYLAHLPEWTIIHGGAKGVDRQFGQLASIKGAEVIEYPADWSAFGKAAGAMRNQQMLDEGKPDLVVAFIDKPLAESKGTADMVRRARSAGIATYVFEQVVAS